MSCQTKRAHPAHEPKFVEFGPLPDVNLSHPGRRGIHIEVMPYRWLDQSRPTIVVFDKFSFPVFELPADNGIVSHGRISADAAERNGYNVIRVAELSPGPLLHLELALPELISFIDDRTVPVGRGDVVNISAVKSVPFAGAGRLLKLHLTAENVKDMVPQVLERLEQLHQDTKQPRAVREFARRQLASNRAVQRLRAAQVEVVAAGGNDGPDWFNIALMTATTQLSARDASGEIAPWSADNSLTTPADGDFEILMEPHSSLIQTRGVSL